MRLTITIEKTDDFFPLDIPSELTLLDFKALLEAESDIDPANQTLLVNMRALSGDDQSLEQLGLQDDDMVVLKDKMSQAARAPANPNALTDQHIEAIRMQALSNPAVSSQLLASNAPLHAVLQDPARFKEFFLQHMAQQQQQGLSQAEISAIEQNPDDPESQRRIMELINQQAIDENREMAYEISPEAFTTVNMLYIDMEVNGHMVKAFVDSGAQTTIISPRIASSCGLDRLIDKRYQGEARGVGTGKILGKVHSAPIKIASQHLPCSFTVLEMSVGIILGLDMLRRHQIIINLKRNVLIIDEENGIETPFLGEADIPKEFGNVPDVSSANVPARAPSEAAGNAAFKRAKTASVNLPASGSAGKFPEATIQQLMGLGFSRNEVTVALESTGGDAEAAASLLFSF